MAVSIAGQRAVEMVKCPVIQEQPLHTAIAHARDWNSALQQASAITQALAQQQAGHASSPLPLGQSSAAVSRPSSTAAGAQHAQQGAVADSHADSASSSEQETNGSFNAQHAQRASRARGFESSEAKHAQQGGDTQDRLLPGTGSEAKPDQAGIALKAQHDGDHAQSAQHAANAHGSARTDSSGVPQQHSTPPQADSTSTPQGGTPRQPQADPPQHEPASSDSRPQSPDSTPVFPTSSAKQDQSPDAKPKDNTANGADTQTQSQPAAASQHDQSQAQRKHDPQQAVVQSMPASLPAMDDLRWVLGGGEQLSMLDGLQALVTGLTLTILAGQVSIYIPLC